MWENIGAAVIYGAIGGGVGALIGSMLAIPFRNTSIGKTVTTVLTVAGVIIGYNVAEPLLKPYIGKYLPASPASQAVDEQFDSILSELKSYPMLAAIFEREPELEAKLKSDLTEVVEKATNPLIARQMGFSAGYNLLTSRFTYYLARAQDDDLLTWVQDVVILLNDLAARDPEFCFEYLYNPGAMANLDAVEIKNKIGVEAFDRQQQISARVVLNAYDNIPEYDLEAAQAALEVAATALQASLGPEKIGLVTGQLSPKDASDAELACRTTADLYNSIFDLEDPVLLGRHIFVNAAG